MYVCACVLLVAECCSHLLFTLQGYWGYEKEYSREQSLEAYKACVEAGEVSLSVCLCVDLDLLMEDLGF